MNDRSTHPKIRVYRVEALYYIFAAALVVITAVTVPGLLSGPDDNGASDVAFRWLTFALLGWFWFNLLMSPFVVRIHPGRRIEFRSLLRRRLVPAGDIERISNKGIVIRGQFVRHRGGTIWFRAPLQDTYAFIQHVERLNPSVEIEGF